MFKNSNAIILWIFNISWFVCITYKNCQIQFTIYERTSTDVEFSIFKNTSELISPLSLLHLEKRNQELSTVFRSHSTAELEFTPTSWLPSYVHASKPFPMFILKYATQHALEWGKEKDAK